MDSTCQFCGKAMAVTFGTWLCGTLWGEPPLQSQLCLIDCLKRDLAASEAKAQDMIDRNQWLRKRWDLMPDDLKKNARFAVLDRLDAAEARVKELEPLAERWLELEKYVDEWKKSVEQREEVEHEKSKRR